MKSFEEWDREQTEFLNSCPICNYCKEPIQDEDAFEIPILGLVCPKCNEEWRVKTDDRRN